MPLCTAAKAIEGLPPKIVSEMDVAGRSQLHLIVISFLIKRVVHFLIERQVKIYVVAALEIYLWLWRDLIRIVLANVALLHYINLPDCFVLCNLLILVTETTSVFSV